MNFKNFYHKTNDRLKDAILSLWATGDADMQRYFEIIIDQEGLMADPVFQTAFPWEPSSLNFAQTDSIFSNQFIKALSNVKSEDYRFPLDRHPYKHQIQSWDTLINGRRSIAVTTGTGSGKTECFMLPVLYDIYKNCRNQNGINALFLYPLNALIGSQKKRIDAWCRALGGINYAVYNGNTMENPTNSKECLERIPELISRKQIRETPPQILFTNPSMLEYILVRNKDTDLLMHSAGTLRWILLDEAHTLTGSSAAEMALLIRRVVDAFQVKIEDLRFAITSATVGAGADNEDHLRTFMATLCGIPVQNIQVITGNRILSPELPDGLPENTPEIRKLRDAILKEPALSLSTIGEPYNAATTDQRLERVDTLSNQRLNGQSIFPVRGHFFARGISGVFVCTNPNCSIHQNTKPRFALGTMTTIAGNICKCGAPMLELVACRSCGNQMLESEMVTGQASGDQSIRMVSAVTQDPFAIDNPEEDNDSRDGSSDKFYFTRNFPNARFKHDTTTFTLVDDGKILYSGTDFIEADSGHSCPHCGEGTANPLHFRISSSIINRVLADIFLEETPEATPPTREMLWKGHKYISFTDSRQGTAKISALINQDNEANWIRSQIYHRLCEKKRGALSLQPEISKADLEEMIAQVTLELEATKFAALRLSKEQELQTYRAMLENPEPALPQVTLSWPEVISHLMPLSDLGILFRGNNPHDAPVNKERYLMAILYDQFARRLPRERSLENLGMVNLVYPKLLNLTPPAIAIGLGITNAEWASLLKIGADYILRYSFYLFIDDRIKPYSTSILSYLGTEAIFDHEAPEDDVRRWPGFDRKLIQNRLALLICAGLGYHELEEIDRELEDRIQQLMQEIWRTLRAKVLSQDGRGYRLRLEEATQFQLAGQLWLCPVKRRLIDAQFRGYSPWIKGLLTNENIAHYKIEKSVTFPYFPFAYNKDADKNFALAETRDWIAENRTVLKQEGIWNNLHEQVILNRPLYLSGEHSAQQTEERLKQLEGQFERSEINILNCSTTMEMGVDIGGISTVIMNNVPPSPANYLQRAGRAGRRAEAQSLAFTICAPNPVGLNAMSDPMWALAHKIAAPLLSFNSDIVVERHINAFFLGKFVQGQAGLDVRMTNDAFYFSAQFALAERFSTWLNNGDLGIYDDALRRLVRQTPLQEKNPAYLLRKTIAHFQQHVERTLNKKNGFDEKLEALAAEFGDESPAYKSANYQRSQFVGKNAIGYLAEEGFLPGAGLPTGIVEFDTLNIEDLNNKNRRKIAKPSYFITRALSEFAPGREVVIDGKSYASAGILFKNDRGTEASREIVQSCRNCGYQRITEVSGTEGIHTKCAHCDGTDLVGINFNNPQFRGSYTEMIQPAGFAVDIYETPGRKITESSSINYVDPLLINIKPWPMQGLGGALYDARESGSNAEILYYNQGKGNGYAVCLHCGRTEEDAADLINHKRLRGGKDNDHNSTCSGNSPSRAIREHVIFGGRFKTDFCELRFRDESNNFSADPALLYTLGAILSKELAHYLAVEENEISFGLKFYDQYATIFIFDTAKGGAGYSSQFTLYADEIFRIAYERLAKCDCEHACTKCLIDRATQWHLDRLERTAALKWLERAINIKVPENLIPHYPTLKPVIGGIKDEIGRLSYANKIQEIWFYVSANVLEWDLEQLPFINSLRNKVKINFVLDAGEYAPDRTEKISLIQLSAWADIFRLENEDQRPLKTLCMVLTNEGLTAYLAASFQTEFAAGWGNIEDGLLYKDSTAVLGQLTQIECAIDEQSMAESKIIETNPIISNEIAGLFLKGLGEKIDLDALMRGKAYEVTYADRYLKTPLGCLLLVQFINQLRETLGFTISIFNFYGKGFMEERSPYLLFHNFANSHDRNTSITVLAQQIGIDKIIATDAIIPHYRYLEFKSGNQRIIIRPDAGIEHGWFLSAGRNARYNAASLNAAQTVEIIKQDNNELLYTLSIE